MADTGFLMTLLVLTSLAPQPSHSADLCLPGMFLYTPRKGPDVCLYCNPGTFMPFLYHKYRQCFVCTSPQDNNLEIFIAHCNTSHDSEIHCIDGYYRTKPSYPKDRGHCQKCTVCPFPKRPCQKFSDTICCPAHNYDVFINKHGNPECFQLCRRGQLLDPDTDQCLPCPANTYMHVDKHTHGYCQNCQVPKSDHEVVLRPCNSTHPSIIGCVDGYYRRKSLISLSESCVKCQDCTDNKSGHVYEGRACDRNHDTVCCPQPEMIVVDSLDGPECTLPATKAATATSASDRTDNTLLVHVKLCGKGEYLSFDYDMAVTACLPCPVETCMDEINHVRTRCHSCDTYHRPAMRTSACEHHFKADVIILMPIVFLCCHSLTLEIIQLFVFY